MSLYEVVLIITILSVLCLLFIKIMLHVRRKGGSMASTVYGAVDEFLTTDRKKAIEVVVNKIANKKMEEKTSSDPKEKKD